MAENNKNNRGETEGKLFQSGGPGGPGRGNKKPVKALTLNEIEEHLQHDLRSSDAKIRHKAVGLLLAIRKVKVSDEPVTLHPELAAMRNHVSGQLFDDDEVEDVDESDLFE